MPEIPARLHFLRQTWPNGLQVVETQFYPESTSLIRTPREVDEEGELRPVAGELKKSQIKWLTKLANTATRDLPPIDMWQRRLDVSPVVERIEIKIKPPKDDKYWLTPVVVKTHAMIWQHSNELWLARIPMLAIDTFAKDRETLDSRIRSHIRFALQRKQASLLLADIVHYTQHTEATVQSISTTFKIRTPKQIESNEGEREVAPVLKEVADRLGRKPLPPAFEVSDDVDRVAEELSGQTPRSVLLIGPSGVGKTAILNEVIRRKAELELGQTQFFATSGSRLVAGMCGFGMWQERCEKLCSELKRNGSILYVGNLPELVEAGKGGGNSQGIADFFRNRIDRAELIVVSECTPEQFSILERNVPGVVRAFQHVRIKEPALNKGRSILMDYSLWATEEQRRLRLERQWKKKSKKKISKRKRQRKLDKLQREEPLPPPLSIAAIEKLDRLHRRYGAYSAFPGRAIRFLYNLIEDREDEFRTLEADDVTTAFSNETGLPQALLDETHPLDSDAAKQWFADRVIGQRTAIDVVVDLVTTVKAGLARPDRPIASLLFIGPTGVGKTEMAKTIAEFFFRDRNRMVRIDMSEYSDPSSIDRLVGGPLHKEGLLTSRVRDQPFGVVLLDEFEKADPRFFDLLLQVLGEGRLTDGAGNLADFRNSIIIMTSNLGVEAGSRGSVGFAGPEPDDSGNSESNLMQNHFVREVQEFLRPEMFNRIDRIVPFRALDRETLKRITDRELELVRQRDGIQYRGVRLEIAEGVIDRLAQHGFDPRYGARPLKRAIETHLLQPMSSQIVNYEVSQGLAADISLPTDSEDSNAPTKPTDENSRKDQLFNVEVRGLQNETVSTVRLGGAVTADDSTHSLTKNVSTVRREVGRLNHCSVVMEARNELYRFDQAQERRIAAYDRKIAAGQINVPYPSPDQDVGERCSHLRAFIDNVDQVQKEAISVEEDLLVSLYQGEPYDAALVKDVGIDLQRRWETLLLTAYAMTCSDPKRGICFVVASPSDSIAFARQLIQSYSHVLNERNLRFHLYSLRPAGPDLKIQLRDDEIWINRPLEDEPNDARETMIARSLKNVAAAVDAVGNPAISIAFHVRGHLSAALLELERGRHEYKAESKVQRCIIDCAEGPIEDFIPDIQNRNITGEPLVRTWNAKTRRIIDSWQHQGEGMVWARTEMDHCLNKLMSDRLLKEARKLIEI